MVVTTSDGFGKVKLAQPGNREWATVIQGVNALGWAIPPFIILAAQYHLANWYTECNLPANWRFATTDNGWTTNAVGLDWIKHFDSYTAPRTTGKNQPIMTERSWKKWPCETEKARIFRLTLSLSLDSTEELDDAPWSLQINPYQVPRDRDLGAPLGPIPQQEVGRLRKQATAAGPTVRGRLGDPENDSREHHLQSLQRALLEVPKEKTGPRPEA
ncbi:hypothetical protein VTI74DRAFT_1606 [Chaetomium olivicolor]